MNKNGLLATVAVMALLAGLGQLSAQQSSSPAPAPAPSATLIESGKPGGMFSGYIPSTGGADVAGSEVATANAAAPAGAGATPAQAAAAAAPKVDDKGKTIPDMSNGRTVSADKIEGFNSAVDENFPMTPEMVRRYRDIYDENQRALLERPEPNARVDAGFISLEPGETPPAITLAPGIASVIGFYDVTGQPWPISQYVVGAGDGFQVIQLGDNANNLAMTPLTKLGFTNLVVVLRDQPKPVVMRVGISEKTAHFRHDVQILSPGPNASANTAATDIRVREAGSETLLAVLSGVDIPQGSKSVQIQGVDARGWIIGETLFLRSKHPLLSPAWLSSMSGPDGVRVYEIKKSSAALFSVDGQIIRADVVLP